MTPRAALVALLCGLTMLFGAAFHDAAAAKSAVTKSHCRTGAVMYAWSRKVKKGKVVSQGRPAGRVLAPNAKIDLVVSRGPKKP